MYTRLEQSRLSERAQIDENYRISISLPRIATQLVAKKMIFQKFLFVTVVLTLLAATNSQKDGNIDYEDVFGDSTEPPVTVATESVEAVPTDPVVDLISLRKKWDSAVVSFVYFTSSACRIIKKLENSFNFDLL